MAKKLELQESWQLSQSAWSHHALSATFFCGDQWRPLRTAGQMGELIEWARILAYISGTMDQDPGRPRVERAIEELIVRMAEENRSWGYDRIVGALANLGFEVSDQTVGNVLRRHGVSRAPERKRTTTWQAFIRTHLALLAGTDFFVLTLRGLATYYVLFAAGWI